MPKPNYMKKQTDINHQMRSILVDWLVEVAEEYKLSPQTLYLTMNYIDRFLSVMSVLRGKLQLVGTACMLIAAKFEEIYPPEVSDFVYITDDTYNTKQVMSKFILFYFFFLLFFGNTLFTIPFNKLTIHKLQYPIACIAVFPVSFQASRSRAKAWGESKKNRRIFCSLLSRAFVQLPFA